MEKISEIIRHPDFAGGGITEHEKHQLDEHVQLWIKRIMRTAPIEQEKIIPAIERLYKVSGLNKPRVIIVSSPFVMAMAGGFSAAIWYNRKQTTNAIDAATRDATFAAIDDETDAATRNATFDAIDDAIDAATRDATRDATDTATRNATYDATYDATDAATRDATYDATFDATDAATRDATRAVDWRKVAQELTGNANFAFRCVRNWWRMYQGGNMWGQYDCYLTAARDVLGLNLPEHKNYEAWEACAINGGYRIMHKEFCMVSDFPEVLKVDDEHRPHCEDGPSHRWRDGWSLYHWHGVRIPAEWIENKESLTPQVALTWGNIEQRRCACEILGWHNILNQLKSTVIDKNDNPQIGTLLEVNLPDSGKERFLLVQCGTGRDFAIPVPPDMQSAMQANAWTYGLDTNQLYPEVRT